jgi:hypothetical protein
LKTGTPIKISKSFSGKPPGFIVGFGFYRISVGLKKLKKSGITSCYYIVVANYTNRAHKD